MALKSLPVQNPYTFNGEKRSDGSVILSGFVPSEQAKTDILQKANNIFGGKVIDRKINIAAGAPDARFLDVTEGYMQKLAQLENCLLYTSPSPRDRTRSRMPSSA